MRGAAVGTCLLALGCGYQPNRVGGDDDLPVVDSPTTDAEIDAPGFMGPPPTACVESWLAGTMNFAVPAFVQGSGILTDSDERDPFVSADQRVLYFVSPSNGDLDVLFATRTGTTGPFTNLLIKTSLSDANLDDGKVTLTEDDLIAFQATSRAGGTGGGFDFWQASRATGFDQAFGAMSQNLLGMLDDAGDQQDPHISSDGLRLYFSAGNPQQIVVSSRATLQSPFPPAVPIANLSDGSGDGDPTLTGDERVLVFTSNRAGTGLTDMWYATRTERDRPFSTPLNLATINTTFDDGDPAISPDGCNLYFASTREGSGDYDLLFTALQ